MRKGCAKRGFGVALRSACAVAVAAALCGCPPSEVLEQLMGVQLEVLDASTGDPIVGASVELDGEVLYTEEDGCCTFTGIVSGSYTVSVNAAGYEPESIVIELTSEGMKVTVRLTPVGGGS